MLVGNYFDINERKSGDAEIRYSVSINPKHGVFDGHFPENPICPGVCSLQMVRECAEDKTGNKLSITSLKQVRYTELLKPNEHPNVEVVFSLNDNGDKNVEINASIVDGEAVFLTLKGVFTKI